LSSFVEIQKTFFFRKAHLQANYTDKDVFAQVIIKTEKFALLFNKNYGLIFLGELANHCALDDVVLAEVKPFHAPDFEAEFGAKKVQLNPSKLVLFTVSALSSGPAWTSITAGAADAAAAHWLSSERFQKFVDACVHGFGAKCLKIMTDKLDDIISMNCNPTYNKLLTIFCGGFDYLIWKDAGCAVVIYSTNKGAILVDDKNGLIVCLYKEQFTGEDETPLQNGQTLYDVSFDYVHFRFVRLSTGSICSMFEVKSLMICNEDHGGFERRVDCLPVTNANLSAFLGHLDDKCLVDADTFIDAACKHLVRKDNLYHDGFVPTFRKRFRDLMDRLKDQQRMLNLIEEVSETSALQNEVLEEALEIATAGETESLETSEMLLKSEVTEVAEATVTEAVGIKELVEAEPITTVAAENVVHEIAEKISEELSKTSVTKATEDKSGHDEVDHVVEKVIASEKLMGAEPIKEKVIEKVEDLIEKDIDRKELLDAKPAETAEKVDEIDAVILSQKLQEVEPVEEKVIEKVEDSIEKDIDCKELLDAKSAKTAEKVEEIEAVILSQKLQEVEPVKEKVNEKVKDEREKDCMELMESEPKATKINEKVEAADERMSSTGSKKDFFASLLSDPEPIETLEGSVKEKVDLLEKVIGSENLLEAEDPIEKLKGSTKGKADDVLEKITASENLLEAEDPIETLKGSVNGKPDNGLKKVTGSVTLLEAEDPTEAALSKLTKKVEKAIETAIENEK